MIFPPARYIDGSHSGCFLTGDWSYFYIPFDIHFYLSYSSEYLDYPAVLVV